MSKVWFSGMLLCVLAATLGCRTPSADWNGTWKLNPSKSSFQGPVITISISERSDYHYDDGASSFTFRCDGTDQPIGKNRTQACVKSDATTLDVTRKENGIKTNGYHWELSADGKVLTATAIAFRPTGPVITNQIAAFRRSGSSGFAGQWQDPTYLQRRADMRLRSEERRVGKECRSR